jgi:hypothetical protein
LIHIILGRREFKFVQLKDHVLFKGELMTKCKNGVRSFKNLILKSYEARKAEFYMKAF